MPGKTIITTENLPSLGPRFCLPDLTGQEVDAGLSGLPRPSSRKLKAEAPSLIFTSPLPGFGKGLQKIRFKVVLEAGEVWKESGLFSL